MKGNKKRVSPFVPSFAGNVVTRSALEPFPFDELAQLAAGIGVRGLIGSPMDASLGDILTFGLGRGEGIGPYLQRGPDGSFGDRLTCSNALDCNSVGQSRTHPIRGPSPVVHLQDKGLAEAKTGGTPTLAFLFAAMILISSRAIVFESSDCIDLARPINDSGFGSSPVTLNDTLSSSIANLWR